MIPSTRNRRLLLVDDNPAIHEDFRRLLMAAERGWGALDAEAATLFGEAMGAGEQQVLADDRFELDSALQGQEALACVQRACAEGRPYALAFVDMRMPPGWDGLTTITKLWTVDPAMQIVICTAYSDRSWSEVQATLPVRSRWLVLKKPFDKVELLQIVHVLVDKWHLEQAAR